MVIDQQTVYPCGLYDMSLVNFSVFFFLFSICIFWFVIHNLIQALYFFLLFCLVFCWFFLSLPHETVKIKSLLYPVRALRFYYSQRPLTCLTFKYFSSERNLMNVT